MKKESKTKSAVRVSKKSSNAGKRSAGGRLAQTALVSPEMRQTMKKKTLAPAAETRAFAMPVMASGVVFNTASQNVKTALETPRCVVGGRGTKPRLLWVGDALVPTGFATVTHSVLKHLSRDWDVIVSGVNYDGSAHDLPYCVMPAQQGGDMWGMNRFQHLCAEFDPAAVVINNDWWNVARFAQIAPAGVPIIGYMPVDGANLDPGAMERLNRLTAAVWYTDFGHHAACSAGFTGRREVIPHGIDTEIFQPADRQEARQVLGLGVAPSDYLVGNINRNQPRKRLDLTIQIFAEWTRQHRISDAHLLLHCAQKDTGWDLRRVADYYGVADRLIFTGAEDIRDLQDVSRLKYIYSSLDVQMTTTLGEGWGLTTMEGMACGIPQIVPDSSALGEWAVPAVKIPCSRTLIHPEINTLGSLVDEAPFVAALQALYQSKAARRRLAQQGLAHVRGDAFRWETVAGQFQALLAAISRKAKRRQETSGRTFSSRT